MSTKQPITAKDFLHETQRLVERFAEGNGRRSCVECFNFDQPSEYCRLANVRPPAKVIAYGCPRFENDLCPF